MNKPFLAALPLAALLGCASADDDVQAPPPTGPSHVAFEGKLDAAMAATWQTPDGKSTLVLRPDGAATLKSNVPTPGGTKSAEDHGQWKAGAGTLLIKKENGETTEFFATKPDANTLEVRRVKDSKIKIVYKRKG